MTAYAVAWVSPWNPRDGDFDVVEWPYTPPRNHSVVLVAGPFPTKAEADHAFLTWPGIPITGRRQTA